MLRASALPAIGTTLSRITGLIRVAALTAALGLTTVSDIYNLANTTPNILYELVLGGVLSSTLVPLFIRTLDDPDDETASVVTTVSFVAISALTMLAVLLSPLINWLFSIPLSGAELARQQEIGVDLLAILLPQILFYGVTTLVTALLHARRRFAPAAFAPVLTNLITAAAALLSAYVVSSPNEGSLPQVYILGFGTTLGVAAMAIVLVPYLRKSGIDLHWRFKPRHPAVKAVVRLSGWTVGFAAANQVALLIILNIARTGEEGAVSAYQYAFIFFQLPHGLIAVSLMTVVMPELAEAAVDRAEERYRQRFREGLSLILTFMIPAAIGFIAIGQPLVKVLLQRGNFTADDASNVTGMLTCLAVGLPAFSVFLFTCRAFFAAPRHAHALLPEPRRERDQRRARLPVPPLVRPGRAGPGLLRGVLLHRRGRPRRPPPTCRSSARPRRRPPVAAGARRRGRRRPRSPRLLVGHGVVARQRSDHRHGARAGRRAHRVHSDRGLPPSAGVRARRQPGQATVRHPRVEAQRRGLGPSRRLRVQRRHRSHADRAAARRR